MTMPPGLRIVPELKTFLPISATVSAEIVPRFSTLPLPEAKSITPLLQSVLSISSDEATSVFACTKESGPKRIPSLLMMKMSP